MYESNNEGEAKADDEESNGDHDSVRLTDDEDMEDDDQETGKAAKTKDFEKSKNE